MGLPPTTLPPIRLLPVSRHAFGLRAVVASLTVHGVLLALVFAGSGHWRSAQPAPRAPVKANVLTFTYMPLAPPARTADRGSRDPPSGYPVPTRSARSEYRGFSRLLPRLNPAELIPTTMTLLSLRTVAPKPVAPRNVAPTRGAAPPVASAVGRSSGEGFGPAGGRGATRTSELLGKIGDACPVLRRPPRLDRRHGALSVAVTFVVDTLGTVDRATLRVVRRPGEPPEANGFIPHIYVVGALARMDRSLPERARAYGTIAAGDVVRHVAGLRFQPALRNNRPVRSSVLVACQAD
jgi:hypothetical protein